MYEMNASVLSPVQNIVTVHDGWLQQLAAVFDKKEELQFKFHFSHQFLILKPQYCKYLTIYRIKISVGEMV
jgi:hypothetical protein